MALESATYLNQLVSTNPTPTDAVGQGDDHIRLLKAVILATFPNFTAAALASTNAALDNATTATANITGAALIPSGTVLNFAGSTTPTGYLLCDGTSYSTTTYAPLFAAIGYTHGGSGGNFNVPDTRGRVIAGVDSVTGRLTGSNMSGLGLGATGGEATHTLVTGELAAHNHGVSDPSHYHAIYLSDAGHSHGVTDYGHTHYTTFLKDGGDDVGNAPDYSVTPSMQPASQINVNVNVAATGIIINSASSGVTLNNATALTGISINNTGSDTAHNNVQPTIILNHIIKT